MFVYSLSFILLKGTETYSVVNSNSTWLRYLSCSPHIKESSQPVFSVVWWLNCCLFLAYGIGSTICDVLLLEFIIAQSPDKMKGFVIGIMLVFQAFPFLLIVELTKYTITLCYDLVTIAIFIVLFLVFLVFSKRYTLRERNREINIQAIVEEHYERYMDQEEEYMRQQHY